jgi:HAD superfamily hydrolase (TIGR01509 family)
MIRGLIFDFDGLMVETEGPAYQSWQEIFAAHGCALPLERWARRIGAAQGAFDPCDDLEALIGRPLDRVAVRAQRDRRKAELARTLPLLSGVRDYVVAAHELGLKLAIASSSPRAWVVDHLERLGLAADFPCIKTVEDVDRAKPDPALYSAVLAALALQPAEAVALEDSPNGIRAAKAAGIFCVAVPNPLTALLDLAAADIQVSSLAAQPLAALLAQIAAIQSRRPVTG